MKNSFPTMRLWIASLLTLGAVLIQCPAQAQVPPIGRTKDNYRGKTYYPRGEASTPSVSPEEAARQQAQAEERRRQDVGDKANDEGVAYQKQGNWDAAVQAYEKALQNWDHEIIRNNLTRAKEQVRLQRERVQQEQERQRRDAAASASIKQGVDRLITVLGNQSATGNLDSPATGTPRPGGGLDFITDPAAVLPKPVVSNTREPNTEARPQLYSIEQHSKELKTLSKEDSSDERAITASGLAREGFDKSTTRGPVNEQAERAVQNLAQRDRTNPDGDPIVPQQIRNQNPKITKMERQREGLKQKRQAASDQIAKIEQDLKTTTDARTHGELLVKRTEALQNETNLTNQIYTINFNIAAEIPKPSEVPAQKGDTPNAKTRPTKN